MSDSLIALDATFLELEQQDEGALMGIGGVSVFDPVLAASVFDPDGWVRMATLDQRRPIPDS